MCKPCPIVKDCPFMLENGVCIAKKVGAPCTKDIALKSVQCKQK
jgi:hypothetical protein